MDNIHHFFLSDKLAWYCFSITIHVPIHGVEKQNQRQSFPSQLLGDSWFTQAIRAASTDPDFQPEHTCMHMYAAC